MKKIHLVAVFLSCFGLQPCFAMPAEIILIRHAEKPDDGDGLSARGKERAKALVGFFETRPELLENGRLTAIFAMEQKNSHSSVRAIETVQPLADDLKLKIRADYKRYEEKDLADEIENDQKLDGKTIVICWEHNELPDLAHYLGARHLPADLGSDIFDRAWILKFAADGTFTEVKDIAQHLLPGDSAR